MQQQITRNRVLVLLATSKISIPPQGSTMENEISSSTGQADYKNLKNHISQVENSVVEGFITCSSMASQQVEVLVDLSQHGSWKAD